jgi:hypothetical protein
MRKYTFSTRSHRFYNRVVLPAFHLLVVGTEPAAISCRSLL